MANAKAIEEEDGEGQKQEAHSHAEIGDILIVHLACLFTYNKV